MDLDFANSPFTDDQVKSGEIEEAFEDPFALRLIPDSDRDDGQTRFYLLGKTVSNRPLFIVFWTNGKQARIFAAREATSDEISYYERHAAENI